MADYNAVRVFSATKARERNALGDRVTEFLKEGHEVVDTEVLQSSDSEYHCLTFVLFVREFNGAWAEGRA